MTEEVGSPFFVIYTFEEVGMELIKMNRISIRGKSYKLGLASSKGGMRLKRTTKNNPDALAVVIKGKTPFCCPKCGDDECVKKSGITGLRFVLDIDIDLKRSWYREIRVCRNNQDNIRNEENIERILDIPNNKKEILDLLQNQSKYFYLVEHIAHTIIDPPHLKKINCPSCNSHKFREETTQYLKNQGFIHKSIQCPSCSMEFAITKYGKAMDLIIDQLSKRYYGNVALRPFGENIKHIFVHYGLSTALKIKKEKMIIAHSPTDYIKLNSPITLEEILTLFRKYGGGGKTTSLKVKITHEKLKKVPKRSSEIITVEDAKEAYPYIKSMQALTKLLPKKERNNSLIISVSSGWFTEIMFLGPKASDFGMLEIKNSLPWIKFYHDFCKYLINTNKTKKRVEGDSIAFVSSFYPTQIRNIHDWGQMGKWKSIAEKEIMLYSINL